MVVQNFWTSADTQIAMSRLTSQRAAKAATVAAELYGVGELAQGLSLISKNARTLVAGVGDKARGLGVIAQRFSELADRIIGLTETVGSLAVRISQASVASWRIDNTCTQLLRAVEMAADTAYIGGAKEAITRVNRSKEDASLVLKELMKEMSVLLDDIGMCIRTSEVISVTFLLEASQTGTHENVLVNMASGIKSISAKIKDELVLSRSLFEVEDTEANALT